MKYINKLRKSKLIINQISFPILQKSTLQIDHVILNWKKYYKNKKTHSAPEKNFVLHHSLKINKWGILTSSGEEDEGVRKKIEQLRSVPLFISCLGVTFLCSLRSFWKYNIVSEILVKSNLFGGRLGADFHIWNHWPKIEKIVINCDVMVFLDF